MAGYKLPRWIRRTARWIGGVGFLILGIGTLWERIGIGEGVGKCKKYNVEVDVASDILGGIFWGGGGGFSCTST